MYLHPAWIGVIGVVIGFGSKALFDLATLYFGSRSSRLDRVYKLYLECLTNAKGLRDIREFVQWNIDVAPSKGWKPSTITKALHKMMIQHEFRPVTRKAWDDLLGMRLWAVDQAVVAEGLSAYELMEEFFRKLALSYDAARSAPAGCEEDVTGLDDLRDLAQCAFMMFRLFLMRLPRYYRFLRKRQMRRLLNAKDLALDRELDQFASELAARGLVTDEELRGWAK